MNDTVELGLCPKCEREGVVGKPCGRRACKRRGYHHISDEHIGAALTSDDMIGRRIDDYVVLRQIGTVVRTEWRAADAPLVIWWRVDANGVLKGVGPRGGWTSKEFSDGFEALVGKSLDDLADCMAPTELGAVEVLALSALHARE